MARRTVFISYSRTDRDAVDQAVDLLRAGGVRVFLDIASIEFGDRWKDALQEALRRCERVMVFWSRAAAASEWVEREWRCALELGKRIVPTLLDLTPLPAELAEFQAVRRLMRQPSFTTQSASAGGGFTTGPMVRPPMSAPRAPAAPRRRRTVAAIAGGAIVLAIAAGGWWLASVPREAAPVSPPVTSPGPAVTPPDGTPARVGPAVPPATPPTSPAQPAAPGPALPPPSRQADDLMLRPGIGIVAAIVVTVLLAYVILRRRRRAVPEAMAFVAEVFAA